MILELVDLNYGSRKLEAIVSDCKLLADKGRLTRFLQSKDYSQNIQAISASITAHIQEFTVHILISFFVSPG